MIAEDPAWFPVIEAVWGDGARRITRYAIKKEPDVFDPVYLRTLTESADARFTFRMIDRELYQRCLSMGWSRDFVGLFESWEQYRDLGIGVVAMDGNEIVAGASSYTRYKGGIEIEIDTRTEYRRQGLAVSCASRLILACLERGLYPSWDAHTPISAALAEKLGYHIDRPYVTYAINQWLIPSNTGGTL